MPKVSVIIAAWNAEAFIGRALECALAQQGVELEVVVADDASTDGTAAVVAAVADRRVRHLRLPQNRGPAGARNAAFAAAKGEWLLILDADDEMASDRAASLLAAAEAARADIIADNFWIADASDPAARRLHIPETLDGGAEPISLADYIRANRMFQDGPALGYLKPMFRARFLADHGLAYDERMRIGEDYALVVEAMARGARYVRLRSAGYVYVTHEGSISHRLSAAHLEPMIAFDRAFLAAGDHLTAAERSAAAAHLASLEDAAAFTAMVDGLKARRPGAVVAAALARPAALRHFSMPVMARLRPRKTRWA